MFIKDRYRKDAFKLQYQIDEKLSPLFNDYIRRGYSIREISHLILLTVFELELDNVMEYSNFNDFREDYYAYLEQEKSHLQTTLLFRTLIGLTIGLFLGILSGVIL
jgi:hypothetical protein